MPIKKSLYLEQAHHLLKEAAKTPLLQEERKAAAIELADLLMKEVHSIITPKEKHRLKKIHALFHDPQSRCLLLAILDQVFRPSSKNRVIEQMINISIRYGILPSFSYKEQITLFLLHAFGKILPKFFFSSYLRTLQKKISEFIFIGNYTHLLKYLNGWKKEKVVISIAETGEATYGKKQARKHIENYLDHISNPSIEYVSIKINLLHPLFHLSAQEAILPRIKSTLRLLLEAANRNFIITPEGHKKPTFINFEMDSHTYLDLTVTVFQDLLSEAEFINTYAGITLQAYLPESFPIQTQLTQWAKERVQNGGSPIKISLVKGAYLGEEQIKASKNDWPQAPFLSKVLTDAHFKKMVSYGMLPENIRMVHLGIATHNIFDIAYALLLAHENGVLSYVYLEMQAGIFPYIRRIAEQFFLHRTILFTPKISHESELTNTVPYLLRTIDAHSSPESFLRHFPFLYPHTKFWEEQTAMFSESFQWISSLESTPRHKQNRLHPPAKIEKYTIFSNEPHTDFSQRENRRWACNLLEKCKHLKPNTLPLQIGGKEIISDNTGLGYNISSPEIPFYHYALASSEDVDMAIQCAKEYEKTWKAVNYADKVKIINDIAQNFRARRDDLIAALVTDVGKILPEADAEVCEAIDTIEYYRIRMEKFLAIKDIEWEPKGTFWIISSRSFPCSAPTSSIIAALITGNCAIFKPAPEAALVGSYIAQAMWDANVPKEALQLIHCTQDITETHIIPDRRISSIILTGKSSTAHKFLHINPQIDLTAITHGNNAMIITAMADKDRAIKELVESAFGYSGQKYGSTSLAILEEEVYNDIQFLENLKEAALSLIAGPSWNLETQIPSLINFPEVTIKKSLTELDTGEKWLLQPTLTNHHPYLWSPGIKMGSSPKSFSFRTPCLGPVLSLVRAKNFRDALDIAAQIPFSLSAGIQSLDPQEQYQWQKKIEVGNFYINKSMTSSSIRREPFGGIKKSSFGHGYKTGGPNFLKGCMHARQTSLPQQKRPVSEEVNRLTSFLEKLELNAEDLGLWYSSVANYSFWWHRMKQFRDPSKIIGQDNLFGYVPKKKIILRIEEKAPTLDYLRVIAAALTCKAALQISFDAQIPSSIDWFNMSSFLKIYDEPEDQFISRIRKEDFELIRMLTPPSYLVKEAAAASMTFIATDSVLANGRLELLHYLRECTISCEYERYGNLSPREGELRKPPY
ncbi:MAG: proline dehydrogenase family protein [Parachlamydiales bacterium]|nr:proline dehydrogenase family protein [Parachlamydiales bacterium]